MKMVVERNLPDRHWKAVSEAYIKKVEIEDQCNLNFGLKIDDFVVEANDPKTGYRPKMKSKADKRGSEKQSQNLLGGLDGEDAQKT